MGDLTFRFCNKTEKDGHITVRIAKRKRFILFCIEKNLRFYCIFVKEKGGNLITLCINVIFFLFAGKVGSDESLSLANARCTAAGERKSRSRPMAYFFDTDIWGENKLVAAADALFAYTVPPSPHFALLDNELYKQGIQGSNHARRRNV